MSGNKKGSYNVLYPFILWIINLLIFFGMNLLAPLITSQGNVAPFPFMVIYLGNILVGIIAFCVMVFNLIFGSFHNKKPTGNTENRSSKYGLRSLPTKIKIIAVSFYVISMIITIVLARLYTQDEFYRNPTPIPITTISDGKINWTTGYCYLYGKYGVSCSQLEFDSHKRAVDFVISAVKPVYLNTFHSVNCNTTNYGYTTRTNCYGF